MNQGLYSIANPNQHNTQKTLHMVKNDRMAGSVPSWEISNTQNKTQNTQNTNQADEFTFTDFIDMINPLQHIPVINLAYRGITGDTMKPIGHIIGGTIFGGALGLAAGLANAITQNETGKDIGSNAYTMAFTPKPEQKSLPDNMIALMDLKSEHNRYNN